MEHPSNKHEDCPNQHKNSHKVWKWNEPPLFEFDGTSMETETLLWSEFRNGRKATLEQILTSEEENNSKRAGLWE